MHVADVLNRLVDASSLDENAKHEARGAVLDYWGDDLDALSDEEKSMRPAPIDRSAASAPAMFVGGITQQQLNSIVQQAVDAALANERKNGKADINEGAAQAPEFAPQGTAVATEPSRSVQPNQTQSAPLDAPQQAQTPEQAQNFGHVAAPAPAQPGFGSEVKQ